MAVRCLTITPQIEVMAKELRRTPEEVAIDISLWQEDNNIEDPDFYPSTNVLEKYIKTSEEEQALPLSKPDYEGLKTTIGDRATTELGLDKLDVKAGKGNREWLQTGNKNLLILRLSALVDRFGLTNNDVIGRINWLSPQYRLSIYKRYMNTTDAENEHNRAIARRAYSAYNKHAREKNNTTHLIVETRQHQALEKARNAFKRSEYEDRKHEVAKLFSHTIDKEAHGLADTYTSLLDGETDPKKIRDYRKFQKRYTSPSKRKVWLADLGGPQNVINAMRYDMQEVLDTTDDDNFVTEIQKLFGFKKDAEIIKANIAQYRDQLQKILDNLDYIIQDASDEIEYNEGIKMFLVASKRNSEEEGYDPKDDDNFKETWMFKYDTRNHMDSAFKPVKKLLSSLPIRDASNNEKLTLFGSTKNYPQDDIIRKLHREFIGVHDSITMINKLHAMGNHKDMYPWAEELAMRLNNNEQLRTQFFRDFRLAHKNFGQLIRDKKGRFKFIPLGSRYSYVNRSFVDVAKENAGGGTVLSDRSIYDKDGKVSKENIAYHRNEIAKILDNLQAEGYKLKNIGPSGIEKLIDSHKDIVHTVTDAFWAMGYNVSSAMVKSAITSDTPEYNTKGYLNNLIIILETMQREFKSMENNSGLKDVNKLKSYIDRFRDIAVTFIDKSERIENYDPAIRDSDGNSRQSYVLPSFIDNILEGLNGLVHRQASNTAGYVRETAQNFIERMYGKYAFYKKKDGTYRLKWLEDIASGKIKTIRQVEILEAFNRPFERWNKAQRTQLAYEMYKTNSDKGGPYYMLPVISDTQSARFVSGPKYSHDEIVDGIERIIYQELHRSVDKATIHNQTYQINKNFFCVLPELNGFFEGGLDGLKQIILNNDKAYAQQVIHDAAEYVLETHRNAMRKFISVAESEQANVDEFVENSTLANIQMLELFGGDPAFYGDYKDKDIKAGKIKKYEGYKDLQKRFKQVIVPMKLLDVNNPNNIDANKPERHKYERCLYLNDEVIASNVYNDVVAFVKQQYQAGLITETQMNKVIDAAGKIKTTDGQAIRSLASYRKIMNMLGTYDESIGKSIDRIVVNKGNKADRKTYLTPLKPFFYNILGESYAGSDDLAVPTQHKCSEELLLPPSMIASLTATSPTLRALYEVMEQQDIDVVVFSSSVKVGNSGSIDIPTGGNLKQQLTSAIEKTPYCIHEIPFEDGYGIVSEVPEHGIDHEDAIGTQTEKLIEADIPDNAIFTLPDGTTLNKKEAIALYNKIWTEKIRRAYLDLTGEIMDVEQLSSMLSSAAKRSNRNNRQLEHAFEIDASGNFVVPLCDLANLELSSSFLNSIIHKAIGRAYMNGGQYVQTTAFGLNDKLHLVFNKEKTKLEYIECMMPAWSSEIVNQYIDDQGYIDINDVPEDLRVALGYRIPTSGKSFMAPLKVVGFTPQMQGNIMVLPADITYLNDSDFDVDKMMTMLPSFSIVDGKLIKTPYDINKIVGAEDGALNNMLLDLMRSMLTSVQTSGQVIDAGGTDIITAAAAEIESYIENPLENIGPSFIGTVTEQYARNNDGKNMIAIFASANASHAIAQHTNLALKEPIELFGKSLSSLHETRDETTKGLERISKFIGDALNGAADNAKNPTLYWLNINNDTAGVAALLFRLGYTTREIGLFLNIPAIKKYLSSIDKKAFLESLGTQKVETTYTLNADAKSIINEIKNGVAETPLGAEAVTVFISLKAVANELYQIDSLTKNDTGGGVPHGDLASNVARLLQYTRFRKMQAKGEGKISGWEKMFNLVRLGKEHMNDINDLIAAMNNSDVPIAQAFTSFGFLGNYRIMQHFFPLLGSDNFINAIDSLIDDNPTAENVKPIIRAAYQYALSKLDIWKHDNMSVEESFEWYMLEFPEQVRELIKANPDLMDNALLRDMRFGDEQINYPFIDLLTENLSEEQRNKYGDAWNELLNNPNPDIQQLARDLYIYGYHRNGLRYTIGSFASLAPVEVKQSIEGYIELTGSLEEYERGFDAAMFIPLYQRNNLTQAKKVSKGTNSLFKAYDAQSAPEFIPYAVLEDKQYNPKYQFYFNAQGEYRTMFAQDVGTETVYYIATSDGYLKTTPLGWGKRASEYAYTENPRTISSLYANFDIDAVERKLRGEPDTDEEEVQSDGAELTDEERAAKQSSAIADLEARIAEAKKRVAERNIPNNNTNQPKKEKVNREKQEEIPIGYTYEKEYYGKNNVLRFKTGKGGYHNVYNEIAFENGKYYLGRESFNYSDDSYTHKWEEIEIKRVPKAVRLYFENKTQVADLNNTKSTEDSTNTNNPKSERFTELTFAFATDEKGNPIKKIYAFSVRPNDVNNPEFWYFDENQQFVNSIFINGTEITGGNIISLSQGRQKLTPDNEWYNRLINNRLNVNIAWTDEDGNPLC